MTSGPRLIPVLQLSGVGRSYATGALVTDALKSVSLTVMPGDFVAIVGPSGAGKSTLLNILGLLDQASTGEHKLNGRDVRLLSERQRNELRASTIGFVFQQSHVLTDDTAASNASLGLKIQGVPMSERRVRVASALDFLGLASRAREKAIHLSGGERQRVAIARAIATKPTLLLADEPTGALDSANSDRVIEHLRSLNDAGVTVVVITHDPTVAAAATRNVRLVDGTLDDGSLDFDDVVASGPHPSQSNASADMKQRTNDAAPGSKARLPWATRLRTTMRRFGDEVLDAVSSHSGRPGRAALLLVAFLLGTGGLVCSLGISQSAATQVSQRLSAASLDEVVVRSANPRALDAGFYAAEGDQSARQRISGLPGVRLVGFRASVEAGQSAVTLLPQGSFLDQPVFTGSVIVADKSYVLAQGARVAPAAGLDLLDNSWKGRVALVGSGAAQELGLSSAGPGSRLWLNGEAVDVVGEIEGSGRDPALGNSVVLSRAVGDTLELQDPSLIVRTEAGYPAPLAEAIPLAVDPGEPANVRIETVADLRSLQTGVATDLGTLIGLISWVLLALASLSAATAMYLSVQSRAAEIALRRAIGASRLSIWRTFTLEGLIIGAAGGLAGGTMGLFGVILVCLAQNWTPTLDPRIVGLGILTGCVTGVLSATYPAVVAARANPADAIRS